MKVFKSVHMHFALKIVNVKVWQLKIQIQQQKIKKRRCVNLNLFKEIYNIVLDYIANLCNKMVNLLAKD